MGIRRVGSASGRAAQRQRLRREPTSEEKEKFLTAVMVTQDKNRSAAEQVEAKAYIDWAIKTFNCGCKFRDLAFKRVYQQVAAGNFSKATTLLKVGFASFKYDSVKGLLKGLFK